MLIISNTGHVADIGESVQCSEVEKAKSSGYVADIGESVQCSEVERALGV